MTSTTFSRTSRQSLRVYSLITVDIKGDHFVAKARSKHLSVKNEVHAQQTVANLLPREEDNLACLLGPWRPTHIGDVVAKEAASSH